MIGIGIAITGERKVALVFDAFPAAARAKLRATIADLTERLYGAVIGAEPERTGALHASTRMSVAERATRITGRVGIAEDFGKAGALEYGSQKEIAVREHGARLDHVFGTPIAPLTVTVSAHGRRLNLPARDFLRGPLESMSEEIVAELQAALDDALLGVN